VTKGRLSAAPPSIRTIQTGGALGVPVAPAPGPQPGSYTKHYEGTLTSTFFGGIFQDIQDSASHTFPDPIYLSQSGTWTITGSLDIFARDSTGGWQDIFFVDIQDANGYFYFGYFDGFGGYYGGPFYNLAFYTVPVPQPRPRWSGYYNTGNPDGVYAYVRAHQQYGKGENFRFDLTITGDGVEPLPLQPRGIATLGKQNGRIHRIED